MEIKKVLYLTHPEQDYGEAFLFYGLCQVLGDENVVTYPFKRTYYGETADDYILDDGKKGFTEPNPWMISMDRNFWTFDEIKKRIQEFDIIVLSSARTYALRAADEILRAFNGKFPKPLIFTEHEDGDNIRHDIIRKYSPSIVFKRELVNIRDTLYNNPKIYPLPFSCPYQAFPEIDDTEKEIDLFMLCGNTHTLRVQTVKKILSMDLEKKGYKIHVGIDNGIQPHGYVIPPLQSWENYIRLISKSRIGIAVRGWGRDTIRRWEIPAFNTMMLECDCGLITPNPYVDGITCVRFREDLSDIGEKITYYLEHDDERKEIARLGHEHLLKYHTNEKRAQYFIDIIEKAL